MARFMAPMDVRVITLAVPLEQEISPVATLVVRKVMKLTPHSEMSPVAIPGGGCVPPPGH
jgi:hypothetical protein